ncbi:hypothetical protein [Dechloromonas hortensis]|uniref:hypothetical protein n=1 Tax=Dechloromonas hortensis TaxID=337779 RepID=UPI0012911619|nr:hypothetical protein [Dechloromonas hortensis]
MKWLFDELKNLAAQLKRGETWLGISLLTGFGLLTYTVSQFAFKTDSVLRYLHYTAATCRDLSNGPIIFLFCGMIFFGLAVVVTFGEFQRFFDCRKRAGHYEARQALIQGIVWGLVAIGISAAALLFFWTYCR